MYQSLVPFGSQQLPANHVIEFALPWLEQLSAKSETLNVEHQAVLQKLNCLLFALGSGNAAHIATAYAVLAAEARTHFAKEAELMQAVDYPGSAAHIEQHEDLMRRIEGLQIALSAGNGGWSPANAPSMLEQWFVPHLTNADRRLADFVQVASNQPGSVSAPCTRLQRSPSSAPRSG